MGEQTRIDDGAGMSIGEVEADTGISAFTIRYYDKCGFFPLLQRDRRGVRTFYRADVEQLLLVDALRKSGLSIEGIGYYVSLGRSPRTLDERARILAQQMAMLEIQRDDLSLGIARLSHALNMLSGQVDDSECAETRDKAGNRQNATENPENHDREPMGQQNGALERLSEPCL